MVYKYSRHHISVSGFPFHHLHLQGDKRDQVFLQLQSSWQKLPTSLLQQNRTERHSSHHSHRLVDHRRCLGTEAFELSQSLLAHDVLHGHTKALPASPAPAAQWDGNTRNQCLKFMRIPMDLVPRRICVCIYIYIITYKIFSTHIYIIICICIYVYVHIYIYVCMCVYINIRCTHYSSIWARKPDLYAIGSILVRSIWGSRLMCFL